MFTLPDFEFPTFPGVDDADPDGGISLADAKNVALLYEAGLNRRAEPGGLNFWIDEFEAGRPFPSIASAFIASQEFRQVFGDPNQLSNASFVDLLYENVLGRDGEAGGFNFWLDQLAIGRSRESVLVDFAVSPENFAGSPYVQSLGQDVDGSWSFG